MVVLSVSGFELALGHAYVLDSCVFHCSFIDDTLSTALRRGGALFFLVTITFHGVCRRCIVFSI